MNARAGRMTGFPTSSNSPHKLQSIANVSVCHAKVPSLDQTGRRNELDPSGEALCGFPWYKSNAGITVIYNPGSQRAVKWSKQPVHSLSSAAETEMQFLAPEGGFGRAIPPCWHSCWTPFLLPADRPAFQAGKSFFWLWPLPHPHDQPGARREATEWRPMLLKSRPRNSQQAASFGLFSSSLSSALLGTHLSQGWTLFLSPSISIYTSVQFKSSAI